MGKVLYIGFKGKNNASARLAESIAPDHLLLTNSFDGLKRDIDSVSEEYEHVVLFGVDKSLIAEVRIEKSAVKDDKRLYSKLESSKLSEALKAAGINHVISDNPQNSLCNDAYWHALARYEGRAVFIHIPTIKHADDVFLETIKSVLTNSFAG